MPLHRRIPHLRGFKNTRKKEFNIVNVGSLEKFSEKDAIDFDLLLKNGMIRKEENLLKILGNGKLTKKLAVKANYFSAAAISKIEAAGGSAEVIPAGKK